MIAHTQKHRINTGANVSSPLQKKNTLSKPTYVENWSSTDLHRSQTFARVSKTHNIMCVFHYYFLYERGMSMGRTYTGIVDWQAKELIIEGKKVNIDEIGGFEIDPVSLNVSNDPIYSFEAEIEELLSPQQVMLLYHFWGKSSVITMSSTANVLQMDKKDVRSILDRGEKYGILGRYHNNTWKITNKLIKERFLKKQSDQHNETQGSKTPTDMLAVIKEQAKEMSEHYIEEGSYNNPIEEVIDFKVGMKGVVSDGVVPAAKGLPQKVVASPVVSVSKKKPLAKNR